MIQPRVESWQCGLRSLLNAAVLVFSSEDNCITTCQPSGFIKFVAEGLQDCHQFARILMSQNNPNVDIKNAGSSTNNLIKITTTG